MSHRPAPCASVVLASILLLGSCGREAAAGEGEADAGGFLRFEGSGGSQGDSQGGAANAPASAAQSAAGTAAGTIESPATATRGASSAEDGSAVRTPPATVPAEEF
ncbi:MAG: hypothetical protein FJ298_12830, partial [Planctomycetes bacterium]|nr:hypothetical protein [Planctomycetota bacterium]